MRGYAPERDFVEEQNIQTPTCLTEKKVEVWVFLLMKMDESKEVHTYA